MAGAQTLQKQALKMTGLQRWPSRPLPTRRLQPMRNPHKYFLPLVNTDGKASMMNELDMIQDIPVQIAVELGPHQDHHQQSLQPAHGSVVELDAMAGEPMSVFVNGTLIAQGEVVVMNDNLNIFTLPRHHHSL